MEPIRLIDYDPSYQPAIDKMMVNIQAEFSEIITSRHSTVIPDVYQLPDQHYWIALHGNNVAGTTGMVVKNNYGVVKRMMVDPSFRGSKFSTAQLLLDRSFEWVKAKGAKQIFLGTMQQFTGAQKFYLKNGFTEIPEKELPSDYPQNPMDTLFYKLTF